MSDEELTEDDMSILAALKDAPVPKKKKDDEVKEDAGNEDKPFIDITSESSGKKHKRPKSRAMTEATDENGRAPKKTEEFMMFERADEKQILAEILGSFCEEMVYQFKQGGDIVTGLSWAGVCEIARRMGNIRVEEADIQNIGDEKDGYYQVICRAVDTERNVSMLGAAQRPKMKVLKTGQKVPDKFAFRTCLSLAQRNAIRRLIPEHFIAEMIGKFLEIKRGKQHARERPYKRVNRK